MLSSDALTEKKITRTLSLCRLLRIREYRGAERPVINLSGRPRTYCVILRKHRDRYNHASHISATFLVSVARWKHSTRRYPEEREEKRCARGRELKRAGQSGTASARENGTGTLHLTVIRERGSRVFIGDAGMKPERDDGCCGPLSNRSQAAYFVVILFPLSPTDLSLSLAVLRAACAFG